MEFPAVSAEASGSGSCLGGASRVGGVAHGNRGADMDTGAPAFRGLGQGSISEPLQIADLSFRFSICNPQSDLLTCLPKASPQTSPTNPDCARTRQDDRDTSPSESDN